MSVSPSSFSKTEDTYSTNHVRWRIANHISQQGYIGATDSEIAKELKIHPRLVQIARRELVVRGEIVNTLRMRRVNGTLEAVYTDKRYFL